MKLRVITKEREILAATAEHVLLPGELGQMDILPGHADLISLLQSGEIEYFTGARSEKINILQGAVEILQGNVTALVELLNN